jgi:hypothetical protein
MAKNRKSAGGAFRFRVSDSVVVPLRGRMLRLRVVDGAPSMGDLKRGSVLLLTAPDGDERRVTILDHAVTSGRASQHRLETVRELDVVIADDDAVEAIAIGWYASGPVQDGSQP